MKGRRGVHILKFLLLAIVMLFVGGVVVTFLWNHLMPAIFGLGAIRFRQAVGLLILCRILFGRPRFGGRMMWRGQWRRRWEQMTPEERERFRAGMRVYCGPAEPKPAPPAA
jgi:hypothetical protein